MGAIKSNMKICCNEYFIKIPGSYFTWEQRKNFREEIATKLTYNLKNVTSADYRSIDELEYASYDDILEVQQNHEKSQYCTYADSTPISEELVYKYFEKPLTFLGLKEPFNFRTRINLIFGGNKDGTGNIYPHIDDIDKCSLNIPLEGDWDPSINWYDRNSNIIKRFYYKNDIAVVNVNRLHGVEGISTRGRSHIRIKFDCPYKTIHKGFLRKAAHENYKIVDE